MFDFWGGQTECAASADAGLVRQLDDLPGLPGQSKCITLMGNARICRVMTVYGSSVIGDPKVGLVGLFWVV
jgi:hypothetical protein